MTQRRRKSVTQDHWVYRCLSADDQLLYVGVTSCGLKRFAHGHSKTARWWGQVARIEVEHLPTRQQALLRERELIMGFKPPHNIIHSDPYDPLYVIPKGPGPTRWLDVAGLARWLRTEPVWIDAKVQAGMPHAVIAGSVRFQAEEVRRWLQR